MNQTIKTNRRTFIATVAAGTITPLAGCLGDPETEGFDDEPISASPEDLVLNIRDFEEEGWTTGGESSEADNHSSATFMKSGNITERIISEAWVFDNVSTAQDEYQNRIDEIQDEHSTQESDIAVEGITWQPHIAYSLFRDANVIGEVSHAEVIASSADGSTSTALGYSETMHLKWR